MMSDKHSDTQIERDIEKAPTQIGDEEVDEIAKVGHAARTDGHGHALVHLDAAAERRLSLKIDWHICPIVCLMYRAFFLPAAVRPCTDRARSMVLYRCA